MIKAMYGGTFNPPHLGHLLVAEYVRTTCSLDTVVFVPCALPPHKDPGDTLSGTHRLAMLELMIHGAPGLAVSNIEIRRGGRSFTIDTLEELRDAEPGTEWVLLVGRDNWREFAVWREPERILGLARVIVMDRPGYEAGPGDSPITGRVSTCRVPQIDISSTVVRNRLRSGLGVGFLVPPAVERYLRRHGLYR